MLIFTNKHLNTISCFHMIISPTHHFTSLLPCDKVSATNITESPFFSHCYPSHFIVQLTDKCLPCHSAGRTRTRAEQELESKINSQNITNNKKCIYIYITFQIIHRLRLRFPCRLTVQKKYGWQVKNCTLDMCGKQFSWRVYEKNVYWP